MLRARLIVKKLLNNYKVALERLMTAGQNFYQPLVEKNNRATNYRIRVVVLLNIDNFFAITASNKYLYNL
jgi:hypothetical protein